MDPKKLSAQELLQLCLDSQDEALWTEFVRRFQPLIAGVVTKRVVRRGRSNPTLVGDLVQDTYLKLCKNNFKALRDFDFRHENAFFGFLKVVASNVVEDYFRSSDNKKHGNGREEEDIEEVRLPAPSNAGVFQQVEREIQLGEINKCLAEQSAEPNFARDCRIFWLYYRQGLTAKAIAELPSIGLSVKGVESTLLRLTRLVRAKLASPPR
jgi:RNA polymerase sigma-70 factor (ECF subfamily)